MPTVGDVCHLLERLAPAHWAFSFDRVGLQVGDPSAQVSGLVVTLDCTTGCVQFAADSNADMVVAHHPLIFSPLQDLVQGPKTATVRLLVQRGLAFASAHTNWDCAPGGVNDALAQLLSLEDVRPFGSRSDASLCKLVTFAPVDAADRLIDALSAAGAGIIGDYSRCAFVSTGTGTFLGGPGSRPALGEPGRIENVAENRIEMLLPEPSTAAVLQALREAHPYEEPAYDLVQLANTGGHPIGRIGELKRALTLGEFADHAHRSIGSPVRAWGSPPHPLEKVAVVGGSGADEWQNARAAGADALLTGEVKHHVAVEAAAEGFCLFEAGHYATEQPGVEALAAALGAHLDLPIKVHEPAPGVDGRPA